MRKQEEWLAMMAKEKEARMAKLLADDDDEEVTEASVGEEVEANATDLQNFPLQSESEANEELQAS